MISKPFSLMASGMFSLGLATASLSAQGASFPPATNAPPAGPGTEAPRQTRAAGVRAIEGWQGAVQLGSGFVDTYGLAMGARVGYTFPSGIYAGAGVSHYFGNTVTTTTGDVGANATFVGAEGGYELFPTRHWEVRPYVFVGPAFIRTVQAVPFASESVTRFAVQPGLLGAYHFGNIFVSAEAKVHITPTPNALTLFGGAGMGF